MPPATKERMEAVLREAVGDVADGVAAVDWAFFIRTGKELYRVLRPR